MKQKLIIGLSVVLLVSAVILIGYDLFTKPGSFATSECCNDDELSLKKMDSAQLGYYRVRVFESQLKELSGITVVENRIFICGNREVVIFDSTGDQIGRFTTDSVNSCIAASEGIIYSASGSRIIGYDLAGNKKITINSPYSNSYFTSVTATDQYVLAADAMNKKVLKFNSTGTLVQEIGNKDSITGSKGFIIPSPYFDLSTGGFDDIWIVNPGKREIENYSLSGHMRSSWGNSTAADNGFIGCCNPAHIALFANGSFVTYEKGTDKIKMFDASGRFKCFVAGAGSFRGKSDFQLGKNNLVKDLATDPKGRIYILDAYNRINIFKPIV